MSDTQWVVAWRVCLQIQKILINNQGHSFTDMGTIYGACFKALTFCQHSNAACIFETSSFVQLLPENWPAHSTAFATRQYVLSLNGLFSNFFCVSAISDHKAH